MSKIKTTFHCQECGAKYAKWQGQCNKCGSWNTISEEIVELAQVRVWNHMSSDLSISKNIPTPVDQIEIKDEFRIETNDNEFNRVLGGGIVPGSITLLGGEPGIGKSTLALQVAQNSALKGKRVLYVSAEESLSQLSIRAARTGQNGRKEGSQSESGRVFDRQLLTQLHEEEIT